MSEIPTAQIPNLRAGENSIPSKASLPKVWTAKELSQQVLPAPKWAVPDLIPEGLMVLAGKPKVGKSWFALCIGLSIAHGSKALGSISLNGPAGVLYLALEDNQRRLQDRLKTITDCAPDNLYLSTEWDRGQHGIEKIERFVDQHPDIQLVIIDTWQKFRDPKSGNRFDDPYKQTYDEIGELKKLADNRHLAVLVIHHAKKGGLDETGDFMDAVLGSTGIGAAADTVAVLGRNRGDNDAVLKITGRDLKEDIELALVRDNRSGWTIAGTADEFLQSKARRDILEVLRRSDEPLTPSTIASSLGIAGSKHYQVRQLLTKLLDDGKVQKVGRGNYVIPSTSSTLSTLSTSSTLHYGLSEGDS